MVYVNSYEKSKAGGHSLLVVYERAARFAGDKPESHVPLLTVLYALVRPHPWCDDKDIIYQRCPHLLPRREGLPSIWAVLSYNLIFTHHQPDPVGQRLATVPGTGKASSPSPADNGEMHELAFSTILMVSSQSLSSVLRKEKPNLAKSFSLFSLPLISYKSPGELNIAKSCRETAGW